MKLDEAKYLAEEARKKMLVDYVISRKFLKFWLVEGYKNGKKIFGLKGEY